MHSHAWPPGLGTRWKRDLEAADVCGSVGIAHKLHRALRDRKCEGETLC